MWFPETKTRKITLVFSWCSGNLIFSNVSNSLLPFLVLLLWVSLVLFFLVALLHLTISLQVALLVTRFISATLVQFVGQFWCFTGACSKSGVSGLRTSETAVLLHEESGDISGSELLDVRCGLKDDGFFFFFFFLYPVYCLSRRGLTLDFTFVYTTPLAPNAIFASASPAVLSLCMELTPSDCSPHRSSTEMLFLDTPFWDRAPV